MTGLSELAEATDHQRAEATRGLKNSFREEIEEEQARANASLADARKGPSLITKPAPDQPPESRWLKVGDYVRALGLVYRVRKVTGKDIIMRPVKS